MNGKRIVFFSGGTGTPKLLTGCFEQNEQKNITIIANTADDYDYYGLYVSPDVDSVLYTTANMIHPDRFWGIKDDSFNVIEQLRNLGEDIWFNLGDKDLAIALYRTNLLNQGLNLTEITQDLVKKLKCKFNVLPMANQRITSYLKTTEKGWLHFQEFWVKYHGKLSVEKIEFRGIKQAKISLEVNNAIKEADYVIIGPSNPVTSIGPILNIPNMKTLLHESDARIIVVSPFIGNNPVSGPAKEFLEVLGYKRVSLDTIIDFYKEIADIIVFHNNDREILSSTSFRSELELKFINIWLKTKEQRKNLCKYLSNL